MTDFQFKAIMTMVKDILDISQDLEDAKKAINMLLTICLQNQKIAILKRKNKLWNLQVVI